MRLRCRIPLADFELDLDVAFDARVTAIFGPSGSGKTTLLDAISGLRSIAAGDIEINGTIVFSSTKGVDLPARMRGIGYVPQEAALFPHLSVRHNVLFGARRAPADRSSSFAEFDHVLKVLEIGHLLNRPVTRLSGGEARRIALARAILSKPRLLLLDEPLAALDIGLKEKILPYLARVRDEFGIPMIYVTHDPTEVLTLADWVLMIRQGHLVAQGVPRETLGAIRVTRMIGGELENVLTATLFAGDAAAGVSRARLASGVELCVPYSERPAGSICQIRISADDILIATERPGGISASNVLPGTIRRIESFAGETMVTVFAGAEFFVSLTSAAAERLGLRENLPVFLIVKTRSFRLL